MTGKGTLHWSEKDFSELTNEEFTELEATEPGDCPELYELDDWPAWAYPHWGLLELLTWIATRSSKIVAGVASRAGSGYSRQPKQVEQVHRLLVGDLERWYPSTNIHLASFEAIRAFARGELVAFGRKNSGEVEQMRQPDWIDVIIFCDGGEQVAQRGGLFDATWSDVRVDWRDAVRVWPPLDTESGHAPAPEVDRLSDPTSSQPIEEAVQTARRGPKPQYDWEQFYVAMLAVQHRHKDGLYMPQREMKLLMLDWCNKHWSKEPSDSLIREKIALVYNQLQGD